MDYKCLIIDSDSEVAVGRLRVLGDEGIIVLENYAFFPDVVAPMNRLKISVPELNKFYVGFVAKVNMASGTFVFIITRIDSDDLRASLRVDMGDEVTLRILPKGKTISDSVVLLNLGDSGLAFVSNHHWEVGTEVAYTFDKTLHPFVLSGKIVRSGNYDGKFLYGVRFNKHNDFAQAILTDYLKWRASEVKLEI